MADKTGVDALTQRERQCLRLIAPGFSEKGLAQQLGGISPNTIKRHLSSARIKLGVSSSVAAAEILARAEGRAFHGISTANAMPGAERGSYPCLDDVKPSVPHKVGEDAAGAFAGFDRREAELAPIRRNKLSPLQRIAVMAGVLVAAMLVLIAAPAVHDSFQRIGKEVKRPDGSAREYVSRQGE